MASIWIYIGILVVFCILIYFFLQRRHAHLCHTQVRHATQLYQPRLEPDTSGIPLKAASPLVSDAQLKPKTIESGIQIETEAPVEPNIQIETDEKHETDKIPHCIWTFWDTENPPSLVTWCIESWKKHNPSYTIIVLHPSNLKEYLDTDVLAFPLANTPQRTSDFVRIHVLAQHGGIWADASLLMNAPLDWIHEPKADLVCYSIDRIHAIDTPVLENWFLACVPKCDFMVKWRDEFVSINRFSGGEAYLEDLKHRGVNLDTIFCTAYLTMHAAAQYVLQKGNSTSVLHVLDAREGPYKHMRFNTRPLSFEESLGNLLSDPIQPIIKFRGIDRYYLKDHPDIEQQIKTRFNKKMPKIF
jgi:hypothetical protein